MKLVHWFIFAMLILFIATCSKNGTEPNQPILAVAVEPGVVEAWVSITAEDADGVDLVISRDGAERMRFAAVSEITVVDTGLQPNTSHTYRVELLRKNKAIATQLVTVATMDTTSHEFSIESFYYGEKGTNTFYDVKIIDENNIWAVGEIYLEDTYTYDSLGNWIEPYHAAHWDGQKWKLERIPTNACGGVDYPPIRAIFSTSANNIVFAHIDASITTYDGSSFENDCSFIQQIDGSINKIWVTPSGEIYTVGGDGLIAYFNGQSWKKLESNTASPIKDIWGAYDNTKNEYVILCTASTPGGENKLLQIHQNDFVTEIDWSSLNRKLHSVWFLDTTNIFLCGGGVYARNRLEKYTKFTALPSITTNSIRGQDINDVVVVGDFGVLAHYNGKNWKEFTYFDEVDIFRSVDYKENLAVAVGRKNRQAVIYMLRKR